MRFAPALLWSVLALPHMAAHAAPTDSTPDQAAPADATADKKANDAPDKASANLGVLGTDVTDRRSALDKQSKKLQTSGFFETEWHEFDNIDFRKLDESSDQAILDSDDRGHFAFTGVSLEVGYMPNDSVRIVVGASYRGLWGGNQIGNVNKFGGFLFFTSMYAEFTPKNWKYQPVIRIGRQRFDVGGNAGTREFVLASVIDAARIDFPLGKIGKLITIPIEVVGLGVGNADIYFLNYLGQSSQQIFGFRGDRLTRRNGAELVINPEKLPALDVRAYGFYTHLGAFGSGSDISYQGALGNFSDNDWVANFGARASYTIAGLVTPFVELNGSFGIDRKQLVTNDVNTNGMSWSAGVVLDKPKAHKLGFGVHAEARYYEAQGPTYQDNGQMYSHGYVSMRARRVGGLLTNRFLGWRPSAYVGGQGLVNNPNDKDRASGTRVVSLDADFSLPGPVSLGIGYWFLQDTGSTVLDQAKVDSIVPPFGFSREGYRAQARLGRVLGHEIDGRISVNATRAMRFFLQAGAVLPGPFYSLVIGRAAGTQLGSVNPVTLWDVSGGAQVHF